LEITQEIPNGNRENTMPVHPESYEDAPMQRHRGIPGPALWVGATVLILVSVVSLGGYLRARSQAREFEASRTEMATALGQAQSQIQALNSRVDALTAAHQAREAALAAQQASPAAAESPRTAVVRPRTRLTSQRPKDDPRWNKMQTQLTDTQRQLSQTRDDLAKAQADLQDRLGSTRDELNTSIARTHDELVTMQKRGERNYYEFQLDKSKQFQRVGPISVSLRKVNTKHANYDLTLLVDDFKMDKKHVNLYEPVWINLSDRPQPVELVVNQITKNRIQGYISEPKYKKSEITATAASSPAQAPQLQQR
jgi:hypothetical protein